jgi:hypothetical protein
MQKNSPPHELHAFMLLAQQAIASEYARIQPRTTEDPGTAGDQGEENWAELLRNWLPPYYTVVTKGRMIDAYGKSSPQIDVLVLSESYPKALHNKKLYLSSGVVAAFECKNTFRKSHIKKIIETSAIVKGMSENLVGTPFRELVSTPFYGVLAHSFYPKSQSQKAIESFSSEIDAQVELLITHPRAMPDLFCVADLGNWSLCKKTYFRSGLVENIDKVAFFERVYGRQPCATTAYICNHLNIENQHKNYSTVGNLLEKLLRHLAWQDARLRQLSQYFHDTKLFGSGSGAEKVWPVSIYSEPVQHRLIALDQIKGPIAWDEWSGLFL